MKLDLGGGSNGAQQLLTYQVANKIYSESIQIIGEMISQYAELDAAVTNFSKVSSLAGEGLQDYLNNLSELGSEVGRTTSEMVQAATEFRKNSFNDEDSAQLAQVAV